MAQVEAVLTEIKAAAIDVVAEEAAARGLPVIPVDNLPVEVAPARRRTAEASGRTIGQRRDGKVRSQDVTR